jgi:hypothetical protein
MKFACYMEFLRNFFSYGYPKFISNFWKGLFKVFGTNLNFSIAYHPESNGKIERTNKIIEDMLKIYVMEQSSKWKDYIHLVEFDYNNGYRASLKMIPFEALYGSKCNTPVSWDNPTNKVVIGKYLLKEMEDHMTKIKKNLKVFQDKKRIYAYKKIFFKYFKVGEHIFLKVKVKRSSPRLGSCPKLT